MTLHRGCLLALLLAAMTLSAWVWQGRQSAIRRSRSKCEPPWARCRM